MKSEARSIDADIPCGNSPPLPWWPVWLAGLAWVAWIGFLAAMAVLVLQSRPS